jgi:murein DD-endopeptidase MepM/ murein hydrolase activator NlpD
MKNVKFIVLIALIFALSSFGNSKNDSTAKAVKGNKDRKGSYATRYGKMPFNTFVVKNRVRSNDYLSSIFLRHGVSANLANEISNLPNDVFNVRKIRGGNTYAFVYRLENGNVIPVKFIYEKNKVEYYIFHIENDLSVEAHKKPVEYLERFTTGTITSSLWETMTENGANPALAVELSEIYAWTIDFYRIQKNDELKVLYMEAFVEGESIGEFKILASSFTHFGRERQAYYFEEECAPKNSGNYYDEEGNSLKRAFLKAPVKYSRISSKYSNARLHPVTKEMKAHLGTDYAAPTGTPIFTTADGVVEQATFGKHNGYFVKIKHNSVYSTQYLHMSKIATGIKPGVYVKQGDIIGYVGSTGLATGPHVCYRFWKNGKQVDPYKEDLPEYESLEGEKLTIFKEYIKEFQERLNQKINLPS